jgi:hypothetical protein
MCAVLRRNILLTNLQGQSKVLLPVRTALLLLLLVLPTAGTVLKRGYQLGIVQQDHRLPVQ